MADKEILKDGTWLKDVWNCILGLNPESFTLSELYAFEKTLAEAHPRNRTVRDRIRATLQQLRDLGYIEFLNHGRYRRLK